MIDDKKHDLAMEDAVKPALTEPCGNEDCDKCDPRPWFEVVTERVQRLFHTRKIKAADEAEALRIYNEGTAWPSSYDDRSGELLEEHAPVVGLIENRFNEEYDCWNSSFHQESKAAFTASVTDETFTSADFVDTAPIDVPVATAREVGKPDRRAERRRQDDTTKARLADARYAPIEDAGDLTAEELDALEYHACSSGTTTPQLVRHTLLRACRELRAMDAKKGPDDVTS